MKIIFFHANQPDYLAESLFHGLRSLLGKNCIDVPRYDSMYAPLSNRMRTKLRGNGFTLYGLLEDLPELSEDRFFWEKDLEQYDLIVIANIWTQWELFWKLSLLVPCEQLVVLDGADTAAFFPYASLAQRLKNVPWSYFVPLKQVKYFKRELIDAGASYSLDRFLPRYLREWLSYPQNARRISFSIPQEKIFIVQPQDKKQDFPSHIVDQEISEHLQKSFHTAIGQDNYAFHDEDDYRQDLANTRFGITTKRAGWDCFRHYELAANGCVLCFRDLQEKAESCAPHGLNSSNCISYLSFKDLKAKLDALTDQNYSLLQDNTYKWIHQNTTFVRAKEFVRVCLEN